MARAFLSLKSSREAAVACFDYAPQQVGKRRREAQHAEIGSDELKIASREVMASTSHTSGQPTRSESPCGPQKCRESKSSEDIEKEPISSCCSLDLNNLYDRTGAGYLTVSGASLSSQIARSIRALLDHENRTIASNLRRCDCHGFDRAISDPTSSCH